MTAEGRSSRPGSYVRGHAGGAQNEALQQTRSALPTTAAALAAERRCCAHSNQLGTATTRLRNGLLTSPALLLPLSLARVAFNGVPPLRPAASSSSPRCVASGQRHHYGNGMFPQPDGLDRQSGSRRNRRCSPCRLNGNDVVPLA